MPLMHRFGDGMPVSAVLGFCNMLNSLVLNKMLRGERPRIILCCDTIGPTFRHEMYSEYKAHRPEAPIDLIPQFPLIYNQAARGVVMVQSTMVLKRTMSLPLWADKHWKKTRVWIYCLLIKICGNW
jgi:DNA polymerase-1